jgi:hypothetical protein
VGKALRSVLPQRPFTMDGELGCGSADEPGIPGEQRVAPWWIPISFKTASDIDAHWAPMDTCASLAPIYTLKVRHAETTVHHLHSKQRCRPRSLLPAEPHPKPFLHDSSLMAGPSSPRPQCLRACEESLAAAGGR